MMFKNLPHFSLQLSASWEKLNYRFFCDGATVNGVQDYKLFEYLNAMRSWLWRIEYVLFIEYNCCQSSVNSSHWNRCWIKRISASRATIVLVIKALNAFSCASLRTMTKPIPVLILFSNRWSPSLHLFILLLFVYPFVWSICLVDDHMWTASSCFLKEINAHTHKMTYS